jgi:hypothetical protein
MLRQILAMTRKELHLILQKPSQLAALMLVPLAFVAIMSQVFGRNSVPTVAVYALNEDAGRSGGKLMEALERGKDARHPTGGVTRRGRTARGRW